MAPFSHNCYREGSSGVGIYFILIRGFRTHQSSFSLIVLVVEHMSASIIDNGDKLLAQDFFNINRFVVFEFIFLRNVSCTWCMYNYYMLIGAQLLSC